MLSVHLASGAVSVRDVPRPTCPEGFAVIRLLLGGICNTDLELHRGYYGFAGTPGHEFVGEVVECAERAWIGRRVVGEINLACGACPLCARGLGRHCPQRTVLGIVRHPGAFQEFFTLPVRNLHAVPDAVSTEAAVFVEPLAAACEILDQVSIPQGSPVAVLGDGKLGLLIAQVLQAHGCRVHQFGRHPAKLAISARAGVYTEVAGSNLPKAEFEWVVDATGSRQGLATAVAMTLPRGTIILKSTVHGEVAIDTAPVIVNELTLVGSRCGRFEPALELLRTGRIDIADLIAGTALLSEAPAAFTRAAEPGALKILLTPA